MSKKTVTKKVLPQADPGDEHVVTVAEAVLPVKPIKQIKAVKPAWEIKDRMYYLANGKSPLSYTMKSSEIFYFDEEKGYEREIKLTVNQRTVFVDEFPEGSESRMDHIIFRNGVLNVPKNKVTLQKLLSLYHPHRNKIYREKDYELEAVNDVEWLEMEIKALNLAMSLDPDAAEAILRPEVGSGVSMMSSRELKRDLLLFAKRNPSLFLELALDDNIYLRNIGVRAVEANILKLSTDQRTILWASNDRKLMNVPFEEHPYNALAAWFKTDEGMEVLASVEKRLK